MERNSLLAVCLVPVVVFGVALGTIYTKSVRSPHLKPSFHTFVEPIRIEPPAITPPRIEPAITPPRQEAPKEHSATAQGLIDAGKNFPGAKVCFSQPHPFLMQLASQHAKYMASVGKGGHQGFDGRFRQVIGAGLGNSAAEICAESWQWQANNSMYELGTEMFTCWRKSAGHWRTASSQHRFFGADMAQGRNGVWYACIIVAD